MAACTIFKNFATPVEDVSLIILSSWIASDKYKEPVTEIRDLITQGKTEEAQALKQQLPAFTPSATFREKRLLPNMEQYSGFIHLDFDKLSKEELEDAFQIIAAIPYTFLCFISPSGNGLKVFIEVNTGAEHHETAYLQVMQYYQNATGLKADEKCKDITRLCFVSYDPQLYKNIYNEKFQVKDIPVSNLPLTSTPAIQPVEESNSSDEYILQFQQQVLFTNQKSSYTDGNRNNYIYLLASNCNRAGIPEQNTLELCAQHYTLSEKEIKASVRSAFTHHKTEFAKFANAANMQTNEEAPPGEDYLKNTPAIPESIYQQMPELLQQGATAFTDQRERDVFLTGALAILSGCLPGVKGVYAGNEVFPNLFSFAIAPAASGKGALKFAKMLADEYHSFVLKASREAEMQYNQQMSEHKQKLHSKKKTDTSMEELPVKPAFKVLYIPANTSYAKILWHLEQNEGTGIICETEADTLGNVFKQEWGSYSDMLRKSFHHERLSSSRKGNNEFTEVNAPSLSIALSGTPNQVTGLIASSEDGLFSRFIFYAFKVEQQWKDVSPTANNINLTEHFKNLSLTVFKMVLFLQREETIVELSASQWQQLNQSCKAWLNEVTMFTAEEAASIVKRLGLIMYRMAMLFTALRKFENGESATILICTDEDFNTALRLAEIYLQHSILMFNNLPKQGETTQFKTGDGKRRFFDSLPREFTRQQAVEAGKLFTLSARTVDDLLHNATGKALEKLKAGHYRKI
ncbi:MAG: DUF3987 domain-containing protein [Chitinophagaceae bacterium]|nr:DUF3987 domain-containing protein [Chitinophagaceae bacterium]